MLSAFIQRDSVHHAYLLLGDPGETVPRVLAHLSSELGVSTEGNPDLHVRTYSELLVEDARALRSMASLAGVSGRQYFVIAFETMYHEAQNLLLKTLEEPGEGTHFFLVTRTRASIVPTVLSRVVVVPLSDDGRVEQRQPTLSAFLAGSLAERLKLVSKIDAAKKSDRNDGVAKARSLVLGLQRAFAVISPEDDERRRFQEALLVARRSLETKGVSHKQILEHLAIIMPPPKRETVPGR